LLVNWLALLDARDEALGVVETMMETAPVGHSTLNAMLVTEILRGEPRFEAAIATLGIPDPPPEAEAISW
jgi:hypothetical protein